MLVTVTVFAFQFFSTKQESLTTKAKALLSYILFGTAGRYGEAWLNPRIKMCMYFCAQDHKPFIINCSVFPQQEHSTRAQQTIAGSNRNGLNAIHRCVVSTTQTPPPMQTKQKKSGKETNKKMNSQKMPKKTNKQTNKQKEKKRKKKTTKQTHSPLPASVELRNFVSFIAVKIVEKFFCFLDLCTFRQLCDFVLLQVHLLWLTVNWGGLPPSEYSWRVLCPVCHCMKEARTVVKGLNGPPGFGRPASFTQKGGGRGLKSRQHPWQTCWIYNEIFKMVEGAIQA